MVIGFVSGEIVCDCCVIGEGYDVCVGGVEVELECVSVGD